MHQTDLISAEDISRAERMLASDYVQVPGEASHNQILRRAGVDPDVFDTFCAVHRHNLFTQYLKDVDPRVEPAVMTMFMHMFAVGSLSQKIKERKA